MKIILLVQFSSDISTRTYRIFNTLENTVKFLLSLYQKATANRYDNSFKVKYLVDFILSLYDFSCLISEKEDGCYSPLGKDWYIDTMIKQLSQL